MDEQKREGDDRPFDHVEGTPLHLLPKHNEPLRYLPRHGDPTCVIEWILQRGIVLLAFWPIYISVVTTLTLVVALIILKEVQ